MWKTILFDLDGTLTDSGEGIMKSVQYALMRQFGIMVEDYRSLSCFVGPPMREMMMEYTGCSYEESAKAVECYRERYVPVGLYENKLYDGIEELLRRLKAEGFTLAVASSKPTALCEKILEYFGIAGYFTVILGSEPDGRRSAKADVVEEVLQRLGVSENREECVLIGDTKYDVLGAKKAGLASVAVSYGYGPREELEAAWPDCIVDTPEEAGNLLIGLARSEGWTPDRSGAGESAAGGQPSYLSVSPDGTVTDARKSGRVLPSDGGVLFRVWMIGYPLLIDFALTNGVVFVLLGLVMLLRGNPAALMSRYGTELTGIADFVLVLVFAVIFLDDEDRRRKTGAPWRIPEKAEFGPVNAAKTAVYLICASEVIGMFVSLLPFRDARYEALESMFSQPPLLVQVLVVGIIGPVMEELLFRGILFRRLRDYLGFYAAVIFSAAAFGIAHGNLTQGIYAFILGMVLAALYEHFGSLKACIAGHMANNLFSIFAGPLFSKLGNAGGFLLVAVSIVVTVVMTMELVRRKDRINVV